jgi:hypothetical protein
MLAAKPMVPANISRDSKGYLELTLTENTISYDRFPAWCREFLKRYGGERLEKFNGPDCRVQRVRLLGQELKLVFRDLPVETSLLAETKAAEVVLNAIAELENPSS